MTPVKPIIGITPSHNTENDDTSLRPTYPRAIRAAGGLTILLPLEGTDEDWRQLAAMCDGFLFSGGPDLHPFYLGMKHILPAGMYLLSEIPWKSAFLKLPWS